METVLREGEGVVEIKIERNLKLKIALKLNGDNKKMNQIL